MMRQPHMIKGKARTAAARPNDCMRTSATQAPAGPSQFLTSSCPATRQLGSLLLYPAMAAKASRLKMIRKIPHRRVLPLTMKV